MARYETNIGRIDYSVVAVGKKAKAQGPSVSLGQQEVAELLSGLLGLLGECDPSLPGIGEMRQLALEAQAETAKAQPDERRIRTLTDGIRAVLEKTGPGLVTAGAIADALSKVMDAIRTVR